MGFKKTLFPYFKSFCIDKFGLALGNSIFTEAENKLSAIVEEADDRNSKSIRWHMDKNMLPAIAIYLTFRQTDFTSKTAYECTDEILQIFRLKSKQKNQLIGSLPFGYFAFKTFCKRIVTKQYPKQGWEIQWMQNDQHEVCFHMKSCIYVETTQKYGCPELCPLFCKNDTVVLAGYRPAIVFERTETIANGSNKCDFHFKNGKHGK